MVKKRVDIFTLQGMMGHKNITTTRQYMFLNKDGIILNKDDIDVVVLIEEDDENKNTINYKYFSSNDNR
ncbi:hypothetical protein KQI88_15425 [Alkaliphilus sp. MSJ-5]|uniref:Phage integrase family protein n=1 Tax=Alkaliphilus flagellatus TaxID=2841507 RepID=A0ABS6G612_9FIRM|nr:hypothetical protein [Alkaliphilus flagellatus]